MTVTFERLIEQFFKHIKTTQPERARKRDIMHKIRGRKDLFRAKKKRQSRKSTPATKYTSNHINATIYPSEYRFIGRSEMSSVPMFIL